MRKYKVKYLTDLGMNKEFLKIKGIENMSPKMQRLSYIKFSISK